MRFWIRSFLWVLTSKVCLFYLLIDLVFFNYSSLPRLLLGGAQSEGLEEGGRRGRWGGRGRREKMEEGKEGVEGVEGGRR